MTDSSNGGNNYTGRDLNDAHLSRGATLDVQAESVLWHPDADAADDTNGQRQPALRASRTTDTVEPLSSDDGNSDDDLDLRAEFSALGVRADELDAFVQLARMSRVHVVGTLAGTDAATAGLLAQTSSVPLAHLIEADRWLWYDGRRYTTDAEHNMQRRIGVLAHALLHSTNALSDAIEKEDEQNQDGEPSEKAAKLAAQLNELLTWVRRLQTEGGARSALDMASHSARRRAREFDCDKFVLNVMNGTLDLRKGELRPHRAADMCRKLAPVHFDPSAAAPRFERFMREILPDDEVRAFVQRYIGYSLTGDIREQIMLVALGGGSNGKSLLAETLRNTLGEYVGNLPIESLLVKQERGVENDLAGLVGNRFVTVKEAPKGKRFDEARVKAMTGGDVLSVRFLFKEFFDLKPEFKLFLYSNDRPVITGTDHGVWRRMALVNFPIQFVKPPLRAEDRDPSANYIDAELGEKLEAERAGILNWALAGCLEWQRTGLAVPRAVSDATRDWREQSDTIGDFVRECTRRVSAIVGAKVLIGSVYERYCNWHGCRSRIASGGLA